MWGSRPWSSQLMVNGCKCVVNDRPSRFMTSAEMRFFWLLLLIMNCSEEPFTHISEWKRCSPSSRSSRSFFWILAMATVVIDSTSMILFHLSFPLSSFGLESKHAYESEAYSLATSDCLARHSLVLWVELLWNSHHFTMSFFHGAILFLWLWQVSLWFGGAFSLLQIHKSKVSFLLFKLLLNLERVSVCYAKQGDIQELHLILDILV